MTLLIDLCLIFTLGSLAALVLLSVVLVIRGPVNPKKIQDYLTAEEIAILESETDDEKIPDLVSESGTDDEMPELISISGSDDRDKDYLFLNKEMCDTKGSLTEDQTITHKSKEEHNDDGSACGDDVD
jgi:hypothetical protein